MSDSFEELRRRALALAPEERVQIAEDLLASVHQYDKEVEAAWLEEVKRRRAQIESGSVKTIPAEEVFAEVQRLLRATRRQRGA